ncbi:hypothetical protein PHLGIDRAFT_122081 [Phlebiopsis gigantea 11061_1 CR5-6]|uniref:Rho-GAP domain-containing protein n=1 Tax=Phlebiopsis gigantea (strain 11061_1 CR5-6) TaxID=745531 RepID=A0A0C3PCL5_PHLG1|nr:hypothetical protein PHLGIDRAFT_122081 [Phlebiopsis gigantea 11061_1 CR5-6]
MAPSAHSAIPPQVHVNGKPHSASSSSSYIASASSSISSSADGSGWGANFWVTLADPQTGVSFYACPATGEVSWDPPVGNFLLPPSTEGEWWEMMDEQSGLPYYYHTKTGETVWERPPQAFVIPLRVLQNTALSRRLSLSNRNSLVEPDASSKQHPKSRPMSQRSRSYADTRDGNANNLQQTGDSSARRRSHSSARLGPMPSPDASPTPASKRQTLRRSISSDRFQVSPLSYERGHPLAPIPGSPYATDASPPPSPSGARRPSQASSLSRPHTADKGKSLARPDSPRRKSTPLQDDALARSRSTKSSKSVHSAKSAQSSTSAHIHYHAPQQPQSLSAALEKIVLQHSTSTCSPAPSPVQSTAKQLGTPDDRPWQSASLGRASGQSVVRPRVSTDAAKHLGGSATAPNSPARGREKENDGARVVGREISAPVLNVEATLNMTPVRMRNARRPILVGAASPLEEELGAFADKRRRGSMHTGAYPVLPDDLASDILQFSESAFARQYFSTHRTGFIFRRRVPVEQMMAWQKGPLSAPLLQLTKPLHKEAVRTFKAIQRVMGDRGRPTNGSTTSLGAAGGVLEEERVLLADGIANGELRDEIYCQVMKQLTANPSPESVFRGWQLLSVLLVTFPPSKNFEPSLRGFIHQATHVSEGRVDVMAKYCLRRLEYITRKGPRGKPPTVAEIEAASDAAFHPSIFGESLDAIFRLQERNYPEQKVPIILPFLADGILALGGTKAEGIFRVPGDGDLVSELKLRLDQGYYTLDGFDDPHVLASLFKLWLRELLDPLVPDELYNDCIANSEDAGACVRLVARLPTIHRRVVLFVVSFLQLFLDGRVQAATKMTAANLALVLAPNVLRCASASMAVVFTNAQYEQAFVHSLLLHLRCDEVDPEYVPTHGRGAGPSSSSTAATQGTKAKARGRADS